MSDDMFMGLLMGFVIGNVAEWLHSWGNQKVQEL